MHRFFRFALIAVICELTAGSGVGSPRAHAATQNASVTVRVGYFPIADFIGLYTASERGYFRSQGLNVVLTPFIAAGTSILPAMQGGSLDLGITNALSAILATSHGLQPVFVTRGFFEVWGHSAHAIVVMKNSPIHGAKDLEGT